MPNHTSKPQQYRHTQHWVISHMRAALFSVGDLVRKPFASFMTLAVISIAMALPAGLYVLLQNFQNLAHFWGSKPNVTLYLKQNVPQESVQNIIKEIKQKPSVATVRYISPQQGLKEFTQVAAFQNAAEELQDNPIPGVLIVTPTSKQSTPFALQTLASQLNALTIVDVAQLNMAWIKRLYYLISLGKRVTYGLALFFGIGVILIVGNTIRLTTQMHRQEITVLRLIGAKHAFIRRPLLYRGILYGIIGGTVAWLLVATMLWWLRMPASELVATYNSTLELQGLGWQTGISIVAICALLGLMGSWIATKRHLNSPESPIT